MQLIRHNACGATRTSGAIRGCRPTLLVLLAFIIALTSASSQVPTRNRGRNRLKNVCGSGIATWVIRQCWGLPIFDNSYWRDGPGFSGFKAGDQIYPEDLKDLATRTWYRDLKNYIGVPPEYPTPEAYSDEGMNEHLLEEFPEGEFCQEDWEYSTRGPVRVNTCNMPASIDELVSGEVPKSKHRCQASGYGAWKCPQDVAKNAASLCSELSTGTIYSDLGFPLHTVDKDGVQPWTMNGADPKLLNNLAAQVRKHKLIVHPDKNTARASKGLPTDPSLEPRRERLEKVYGYLTDYEDKVARQNAQRTQLKINKHNNPVHRCSRAHKKWLSAKQLR